MKRFAIAAVILAVAATGLSAQNADAALATTKGAYYEVRSELGIADAQALAEEMDLRFALFERLFRFDSKKLGAKLKVRAFKDEASFDQYLLGTLGETRDGATYLHYSRPDRSELVVVRDGSATAERAKAHQSFVQYLRAFIPNPPAWIREGFAIYFETVAYDASKKLLNYEENLSWLETVKSWKNEAPSIADLLLAEESGTAKLATLQPASWALVSFLLNAEQEDYSRFLYESFLLLDPLAASTTNARTIAVRGAAWIDPAKAATDYKAYLASRRTFAELIDDGRAAYAAKEPKVAEEAFLAAAELRPSHYAPHYYLGLLAYEKKDYTVAENHYRSALQLGADEALVSYALGVNAAADGRAADAKTYLLKAKSVSPTRYAVKVDELLSRIK